MRIISDCLKCYVFLNIIHAALFFYLALIYPSRLRRMKFVIITPCFVQQQYLWNITIKPAVGCYNIQANKCHLGCSPLWDRTIRPFWTNSVKLIYISWFSSKRMRLKISAKCQLFCSGLQYVNRRLSPPPLLTPYTLSIGCCYGDHSRILGLNQYKDAILPV